MKNTKSSPLPNLEFIGKENGRLQVRTISNGDHTIVLKKDQSKPFHHPDAKKIAKLYPHHYKYLGTGCLNC